MVYFMVVAPHDHEKLHPQWQDKIKAIDQHIFRELHIDPGCFRLVKVGDHWEPRSTDRESLRCKKFFESKGIDLKITAM